MIENLTQLTIICPYSVVDHVLNILESHGIEAVSFSEIEDSEPSNDIDDNGFPIASLFEVFGYFRGELHIGAIQAELDIMCELLGISSIQLTSAPVEEADWVEKTAQSFSPISIGQFFIYANAETIPNNMLGLNIRAATAFGSGEHPTTQGCLESICSIKQPIIKALDMGCGSGILAMALKKRFPEAYVLGVDNDPESVRVTKENAAMNQVELDVIVSEGFGDEYIPTHGPYDVITANILAKPLCSMAQAMAKNTGEGSLIILAGLLENQVDLVRAAYEDNFVLLNNEIRSGWSILTFQRYFKDSLVNLEKII